jgi:uncharacterized membrane protein YeiB
MRTERAEGTERTATPRPRLDGTGPWWVMGPRAAVAPAQAIAPAQAAAPLWLRRFPRGPPESVRHRVLRARH